MGTEDTQGVALLLARLLEPVAEEFMIERSLMGRDGHPYTRVTAQAQYPEGDRERMGFYIRLHETSHPTWTITDAGETIARYRRLSGSGASPVDGYRRDPWATVLSKELDDFIPSGVPEGLPKMDGNSLMVSVAGEVALAPAMRQFVGLQRQLANICLSGM